jgi:hypothetical protein
MSNNPQDGKQAKRRNWPGQGSNKLVNSTEDTRSIEDKLHGKVARKANESTPPVETASPSIQIECPF